MVSFVRLFAVLFALAVTSNARAADDSFAIDRVLGKADAPITIIEYASTTCGHCATFNKEALPQIKKNWIETGKAKLIYRDFPTGPAGLSVGASMIAHCAGPERYFGVLGLLFDSQDKWMRSDNPLDTLKKLVRIAGITGDDVDACLKKQDLANAIQERALAGSKTYDIESTPSLVINGKLIVGARDYSEFDAALKAAK